MIKNSKDIENIIEAIKQGSQCYNDMMNKDKVLNYLHECLKYAEVLESRNALNEMYIMSSQQ